VNRCFREILNDRDGQVGFIELAPRPERLPGQVVRLDITPGNLSSQAHDREKAKAEATQLARWIKEADLDKLRARSWGEVAILCPRKNWFAPIADALRRVGIDSQIQSETDVKADSPAHAWFSALLTIMTQPRCGFEIVGVLREVFGISDHDLAVFCNGYGDRFQIERETGDGGIVAGTLDVLARIHTEIADKPLFNAVQTIVESTRLRPRLQRLPREDVDELNKELDVVVQAAATAEAEGMTLEQFAELLRANFTAEREAGAPRTDAIQLITCQKAKGLEWDAVIVPFFSRQIYTGDEDFPRVIVNPQTQEAIVAFSKSDIAEGAKDALKRARLQEMERLLYVAITRARHTLVFAADHELFAKKRGDAHGDCLTTWFRSDEGQPNAAHIVELETQASVCSETHAHQVRIRHSEEKPRATARLPKPVLDNAKARAADFYRQLHPSNFIAADGEVEPTGADQWKEAESEFRARTLPSTATRYGLWWHAFAQKIPWSSEPDEWQAAFDENVAGSPGPSRARREWKLLRQYVSGHRDFVVGNIFAEMPFFWRFDQRKCLEGIMDLARFEPDEKKWFLLDWKTNQIKREHIRALCAYYRPQIAAYWKAVAEITRQPVSASIYSTATGQLVVYEEKELADEWERLKTLGAAQFQTAVSRDESDQTGKFPRQLEFGAW
jgi:ATP-dependent exoDNAse (exonuclease V) beta subunit